jgi:glycosyltransferase involved in cell wall biosynthesis
MSCKASSMSERVAIVSPWYPSQVRPFHGSFVRGFAETVAHEVGNDVDVLHLEAWGLPAGRLAQARAIRSLAQLIDDPFDFGSGARIAVRHLPAPVRPGQEFGPIAEEQRRFLGVVRRGRSLPHHIVHAHVGLGGGWPSLEILNRRARLYVTEHATFLDRLFADLDAVAHYDEVIDRASAFLCVSELLRTQLVRRFPHHEDKFHVLANAIDFDSLPIQVTEPRLPRRWIYAGSLTQRKGVSTLVDSFAIAQAEHGDLTLTLVGDGPEREALGVRIAEMGLADRVALVGAVPPERMAELYASHDLLVHLSAYETFGMTIVEAVAIGIPVLTTRSGGPEETMGPIEQAVGHLVDVSATPREVAAAYGDLREKYTELDVLGGRADLRRRYGTAAIGAALSSLYAGESL